MNSVQFGKSDKQEYSGVNVIGIALNAVIRHTTAATAFAAQAVNWDAVNIKLILERNGQRFDILSDVALPFIQDSGFYDGTYNLNKGHGTPDFVRTVVQAAGVEEEIIVPAVISLHGGVNVGAGDKLKLEITVNSGAAAATVDTAASEIQYDIIEGIVNSPSIPKLSATSVNAGKTSDVVTGGHNVVRMTMINDDQDGVLAADRVVSSLSFSSDKLSFSDTADELQTKRQIQFSDSALSADRGNSFVIVDASQYNQTGEDVRLNSAKLNLTLVGANVAASKNWIVTRSYVNDNATFAKALNRAQRHQVENAKQY